jgi:hypothetical protein
MTKIRKLNSLIGEHSPEALNAIADCEDFCSYDTNLQAPLEVATGSPS